MREVSLSIRDLTDEVAKQNQEIPLFRETDSPHFVAQMIVEEAQELLKETEMAFLTDDLTQLAGEIGDVLYLALKMCDTLGLNADEIIRMKKKRNSEKYNGHTNQAVAKEEWKQKGGDEVWYRAYLDYLAHE